MQDTRKPLDFKYSVIILNFHRPNNTLTILKKLVDYKFIDKIIISNGKTNTAVTYNHKKVDIFDDTNINELHGLDRRFVRMLNCKTENIIIMDDDILINESEMEKILLAYETGEWHIVGPWGRNVKREKGGFKYIGKTVLKEVPIILTKFLVCKKKLAYLFFYCKPFIEDIYKRGVPYGNGEDIFFSFIVNVFYDKLNYAVPDISSKCISDNTNAISKQKNHHAYRTELCNYLYSNKQKFKTILNDFMFPRKKELNLLNKEIYEKNIKSFFKPRSKKLILTMCLGKERKLLDITEPYMELYAAKTDADLIILNDDSPVIINNIKHFKTLVCGRNFGESYFFKAFLIHHYLGIYEKILWLDDSCLVSPNTKNLFSMVENGTVAGHGWSIDKARPVDSKFIKSIVDFSIDKDKYINSGVVVYTKKSRDLFSLENIIKYSKLFESRYPHQAFLN